MFSGAGTLDVTGSDLLHSLYSGKSFTKDAKFDSGFGLNSSQHSIHPLSSESWPRAARPRKLPLSLSCWTVFAVTSAINPSSNIAPAFANSSACSLLSVTNFSTCDISFLSFCVRCALTCSTSTTTCRAARRCNSSQILIHKTDLLLLV